MNFYKRYMGDYLRDTLRLSMIQDGAYGRLIDVYYAEEKPLPLKAAELYQIARCSHKAERDAVDMVVGKFFHRMPDGYHHKRIDEEIMKADVKAEANRQNGKSGGRPPKAKPIDNLKVSQEKPTGFNLGLVVGSSWKPTKNLNQTPDKTTTPSQGERFYKKPISTTRDE